MASETKFAIINVRVFDGDQIHGPTTVILNEDVIGDDATGAIEIDAEGGVLLPGLIDCHVHIRNTDQLTQLAKWGVTTALDMAMWPSSLMSTVREHSTQNNLTTIISAGTPATAPGSAHSRMPGIPEDALLTSPLQAAEFVSNRLEEGSDYIKIVADIPGPSQEILDAVVLEAHKANKLTITHAAYHAPALMALASGTDVITHAPMDRALTADFAARMRASGMVSIPTLSIEEVLCKKGIRPGLQYVHPRDSVRVLHEAGVPIFAGTDSNSSPIAPVAHGEGLHRELELLVEAGLSSREALRGATVKPAKYFGLSDRGTVEIGKRADLVLVDGDPLVNIKNTRRIKRVWIRGVEVDLEGK